MVDGLGRDIHYLRLSVTDRCNLRCRYCMSAEGVALAGHEDILRYEELLRLARIAVTLGITRFKVTGGEPLVRKDCVGFIRALKSLPGVEQVTLTTNGLLLPDHLEDLVSAGIDGINISLDTLDRDQYRDITRSQGDPEAILAIAREAAKQVPTKINAVALGETADQLLPLAALAEADPLDVRFIETMPIGAGAGEKTQASVLEVLRSRWPDLTPTEEVRGNGPARYFRSEGLTGRIGLIEALGHKFCHQCNRIRLTSTGVLLPCLYYSRGADLGKLLRGGAADAEIREKMRITVETKPAGHSFLAGVPVPDHREMYKIGG